MTEIPQPDQTVPVPLADWMDVVAEHAALRVLERYQDRGPIARRLLAVEKQTAEMSHDIGRLKLQMAKWAGIAMGAAGVGGVAGGLIGTFVSVLFGG